MNSTMYSVVKGSDYNYNPLMTCSAMDFDVYNAIEFIDEYSRKIFANKEHLLIGISPCNSYYDAEKIEQIVRWFFNQGINFSLFLGEGMSYFNFLALGYSEKEAKEKTEERDRYLRRKVDKALSLNDIPPSKIIDFQKLQNSEVYKKYLDQYNSFIKKDRDFLKLATEILEKLQFNGSRKKIEYPEVALNYFLAEMPLLLNSPDILGMNSSCFIYHQNNALYDYLFIKKKMNQNNQALGFIKI